jgi:hypothetical protein
MHILQNKANVYQVGDKNKFKVDYLVVLIVMASNQKLYVTALEILACSL